MSLPIMPGAEPISVSGGSRGGVLLVHGYTAAPQQLGPWAMAFAQAGFDVEVPLLAGHGTTPEEMVSTTWSDYMASAEACYEKLLAKHRHIFVGGLCMGAVIAIHLGLQHPKTTSGMLLLNTPFKSPSGGNAKLLQFLLKTGKQFFTWATAPVYVDDPEAPALVAYDKVPIAPMISIAPVYKDLPNRIPKITCPIIVFTSKLDKNVDPEESEKLNAAAGPVEQVLLERSNHVACLDYEKDYMNERSVTFAQSIVDGTYDFTREKVSLFPVDKAAMPAIEVKNLVKQYPKAEGRMAVADVSFAVKRGEIFGLLGPNGAGKTTTIGILTTSVLPSGGSAKIMGIDVASDPIGVKQRISVVPQKSNLDASLTAREVLTFHASYHGVPKAEREANADVLLTEFGLEKRSKEKVRTYSGGMAQRLMIARALMHTPDVLFLDEPTNNLDPQSRLFLWDRIRALRERGITVLLTTHDMEEASRLCDRIAIMDHGSILVCDTPAGLEKLIPGGTTLELRVRVPDHAVSAVAAGDVSSNAPVPFQLRQALEQIPGVQKVEEMPASEKEGSQTTISVYHIYGDDVSSLMSKTIHVVSEANAELRDLHLNHPTLENVFIHLTGRNLRS